MTEVVVDAGTNGCLVAIAVGDSLRIELPEDPSTGFRWQTEPSSLVGVSALQLQSVDFQHADGGGVENRGRRVFRFSAESAGQVCLRLELVRAWEGQTAREAVVITVDIG